MKTNKCCKKNQIIIHQDCWDKNANKIAGTIIYCEKCGFISRCDNEWLKNNHYNFDKENK